MKIYPKKFVWGQLTLIFALACFALSPTARATCASTCELPAGSTMQVVEYFSGPPTQPGDHKCTKDGKCSLKGWLYVPKTLSDSSILNRAVVYLHGHDRERREPCSIAFSFLAHGWIVFAPLRSGNTGPCIDNTGLYIDDWAAAQGGAMEEQQVEYLRRFQVHDVDHAINFLRNFKFKGNKQVGHIALMGHSFGGALAVFSSAGTFKHNPDAIADIQGAELSWGVDGGAWKGPLLQAVMSRKVPIFFLQPSNGKSVMPTIELSRGAALSLPSNQFQAALFPPVKAAPDDVHGDFVTTNTSVFEWAPVVMDFFERYMKP